MKIITPDWAKNAIFYQIFPDRFHRSGRTNHPRGLKLKSWGSPPEQQGYHGGDLYGIVDKLEYLRELGITALYLNPIFASAANHRYHTYDYYTVDPLLGGNAALRELLDEAHKQGIYIVLDGVFNHASRGFWQFHHILENGENSPYIDWFNIKGWPLRPYCSSDEKPANYSAWWNLPALPEFNTDNPGVRDFIFDVARHWIEFGIDGWRLDVPFEIDDVKFWQEFRTIVKSVNPDAYICGEVWWDSRQWLQGDQFDSVMNYIFMDKVLSFFGARTLRLGYKKEHLDLYPLTAEEFANEIDAMYALYDWEVNQVQLNLLDSHDTGRALWIMGEDISALKLAVLFQMTTAGAPCIYYGDEVGMSAGDDPLCRESFPWHKTESWNNELLEHYRKAASLRNTYPVLRTGSFSSIYAEGELYAFCRTSKNREALVVLNSSRNEKTAQLPMDIIKSETLKQVWPYEGKRYETKEGKLAITVPGREGIVLINA